jgi:hypothetical protein
MDGVAYATQFVLQLNSAMMEILPLTAGSKLRRKRALEIEDEWKISQQAIGNSIISNRLGEEEGEIATELSKHDPLLTRKSSV